MKTRILSFTLFHPVRLGEVGGKARHSPLLPSVETSFRGISLGDARRYTLLCLIVLTRFSLVRSAAHYSRAAILRYFR